jgi:hypothetical protein
MKRVSVLHTFLQAYFYGIEQHLNKKGKKEITEWVKDMDFTKPLM